jgi:hypothetical protein
MLLSSQVPSPRVLFRVPDRCPACGAQTSINLETTITGALVVLTWCCRTCSTQWPVTDADELPERRSGSPERRRKARRDRRAGKE